MNKKERLTAIFNKEQVDRPSISAWRHFIDQEHDARSLANAMINFQNKFDWDYIKINPRATIYGEIWGNKYDYKNYDGVVATVSSYVIQKPEDLKNILPIEASSSIIQEQAKVVELIKNEYRDTVPVFQTLFSPLAILGYLTGYRTLASNRKASRTDNSIPMLLEQHGELVHQALKNITKTMITYVQEMQHKQVDGFFYSVMGLAREGYLTEQEYQEFCEPYDLEILEAMKDSWKILHTCGPEANPQYFATYPLDAIHWADQAKGNPKVYELTKQKAVPMGGVDELLFSSNNLDMILRQVQEVVYNLKETPFMLAPGCGVSPTVTDETLHAFRQSVEIEK